MLHCCEPVVWRRDKRKKQNEKLDINICFVVSSGGFNALIGTFHFTPRLNSRDKNEAVNMNMRKFAEPHPDFEFVQQIAAQLPVFHN